MAPVCQIHSIACGRRCRVQSRRTLSGLGSSLALPLLLLPLLLPPLPPGAAAARGLERVPSDLTDYIGHLDRVDEIYEVQGKDPREKRQDRRAALNAKKTSGYDGSKALRAASVTSSSATHSEDSSEASVDPIREQAYDFYNKFHAEAAKRRLEREQAEAGGTGVVGQLLMTLCRQGAAVEKPPPSYSAIAADEEEADDPCKEVTPEMAAAIESNDLSKLVTCMQPATLKVILESLELVYRQPPAGEMVDMFDIFNVFVEACRNLGVFSDADLEKLNDVFSLPPDVGFPGIQSFFGALSAAAATRKQ